MNYRIINITSEFGESEPKCHIFTLQQEGADKTDFDLFLEKFSKTHPDKIENILERLSLMVVKRGLLKDFFKNQSPSGKEEVYRIKGTGKNLRLYLIIHKNNAIILGNGDIKKCHSWQDDSKVAPIVKKLLQIEELAQLVSAEDFEETIIEIEE